MTHQEFYSKLELSGDSYKVKGEINSISGCMITKNNRGGFNFDFNILKLFPEYQEKGFDGFVSLIEDIKKIIKLS